MITIAGFICMVAFLVGIFYLIILGIKKIIVICKKLLLRKKTKKENNF